MRRKSFSILCVASVVFFASSPRCAPAARPSETPDPAVKLTEYETRYYRVYTDIDPEQAKEACIRMTKMAEEYHARTSEFAGDIREKLPFYLFKSADEYYAAGGMAKTAGVFNGTRLMAMADPRIGKQVWHVVQHEGFHQFVHAVIGGEIPIWVNEGMAEYFGEGIFTGDGFVIGVIPPWRLARLKKTLESTDHDSGFKSIASMMRLSHSTWNEEMRIQNYDQAWSMVYFLAHGDDGRYQQPFEKYMWLVSHGRPSEDAWNNNFGNDTAGFERQWRAYWTHLTANPTSELYAKANVATLTSFLARALDQKQTFDSFDEFVRDASDGTLRRSEDEWLPPALLESALRDVAHRQELGEKFSLPRGPGKHLPGVIDQTIEGLRVAGEAKISSGRVDQVSVTITGTKKPVAAAPTAAESSENQTANREPVKEGSSADH